MKIAIVVLAIVAYTEAFYYGGYPAYPTIYT